MKETAYIGRDNAIDVQLQDDTATPGTLANTDLSQADKVTVVIDGEEYGSDTNADIVSFTDGGVVSMKLGLITGLAVGTYPTEIIVYDVLNTHGVTWPKFTVKAVESGIPAV